MRITKYRTVKAAAAVAALAACSEPAPAAPELIEPAMVETMLWRHDVYDGRRIAIDGYIHVDDGPDRKAGVARAFLLTSRPHGGGDDLVLFDTVLGKDANQVDYRVARAFSHPQFRGEADVLVLDMGKGRFQDSAGVSHPVSTRVRVTGRLASGAPKEDAGSPTGRSFRPMLTEVTLDVAP